MKTLFVYLAGPIKGCSYDNATDWRVDTHAFFHRLEHPTCRIEALSPMRFKTHLKNTKCLDGGHVNRAPANAQELLCTPHGITTRDRMDVMRSELVIMNLLGATQVSIGTMIELGWADAKNIPVIVVMEKDENIHNHPMVNEIASFIVHSLSDAKELAKQILLA